MSLLAGVTKATNAEKETDRLGGFALLDTDVYKMVIETAYLHMGKEGSSNLVINAKSDAGSIRTMQCFASGDAKGNKTYYEKDGKQYNLPGFTLVSDLLSLAAGVTLETATVEEKFIKLYSKDAGGEVTTAVKMVVDLVGKPIAIAVLRVIEDKTALGGDNKYHPTGETREINDVTKFFCPETGMTALEKDAGATEAAFIVQWTEKNKGTVVNRAKGAAATGAKAGAPAAAPKKLFA